MITEAEKEKALEVLRQYKEQQVTHIIRDDIDCDCPSEDYEPGEPNGECMTDGHYLCATCKHCDIEYFKSSNGYS